MLRRINGGKLAPLVDGLLRKRAGALPKQARRFEGPKGSHFEEHSYSNHAGARTYKLYVPSTYIGEPLPLLVMLHGCTQSPDDFALGTRMNELAEELVFLVAYPEQPKSANTAKCWNWFNTRDQARDNGEPSLIAGITRQILVEFPVDPSRVFVAGLSAGGATAAIMASTYPDLYAAVGIHSGLACGAAHDVQSAFAAMRNGSRASSLHESSKIPTIVIQGDRDKTVNPLNAEQLVAQSTGNRKLERKIHQGTSANGMTFTQTVYFDANQTPVLEDWLLHGGGHAWSGGSLQGSFTDSRGPDASREMVRFFLQQSKR
jgi:poly(hydroxyalkanoate) depolymerase family esterase